jgi:RNA polymerase sigma factor (sigma-70 family)
MQQQLSIEMEIESYLMQKNKLAIALLYDKYASLIYGAILRIVQDVEMATEVTQDVFVKIWEDADQFDSTKERLFSWLYQIARNTALDRLQSNAFK